MAQSLPWARIVAEGIIIVVSILLGLGLDAWWNDRQATRDAIRDLAGVAAELAEAETEIERGAAQQARMHGLNSMLVAELGQVPPDRPVTVPDSLLAGLLFSVWVSDPPTALLNSFASSGQLDRLEDDELRRELLQWISILQDLRDDEMRARSFQDREARPYVNQLADLTSTRETLVSTMVMDPGVTRSDLPQGPRVTRLPSSTRLRSIAAEANDFLFLLSNQSENALARVRSLRGVVARALQ